MKTGDFAMERRKPLATPNADKALRDFNVATDVFTTCRQCGNRVSAALVEGEWVKAPHGCTNGR